MAATSRGTHSARKPSARGSHSEQGYGADHVAERKRWQLLLEAGTAVLCACRRPDCPHHETSDCRVLIDANSTWDLGHTEDRAGWAGPECVPCNRSAGARNARASRSDPMTVRGWCEPLTVEV